MTRTSNLLNQLNDICELQNVLLRQELVKIIVVVVSNPRMFI